MESERAGWCVDAAFDVRSLASSSQVAFDPSMKKKKKKKVVLEDDAEDVDAAAEEMGDLAGAVRAR